MIEQLLKRFIKTGDCNAVCEAVQFLINEKSYVMGILISEYIVKFFPTNYNILNNYAICLYHYGKYRNAHNVFMHILSLKNINEIHCRQVIHNAHFCIDKISDDYTTYNPSMVEKITTRNKNNIPLVTLSITSCKRFNLFTQTINSFIACCRDIHLIDRWICVDDNSSDEDRQQMKKLYPFIEFYEKTYQEKGHPQSMNIIKDMVQTPYLFHMEDDWKFFIPGNYITECLDVLNDNPKIGQCLINKNYSETAVDIRIKGGFFNKTISGLRYYIHEYCASKESMDEFYNKYNATKESVFHCAYWPYFSFRPSLIRTKLFHEIGEFNTTVNHFEMDYAYRYTEAGYISAFLENISCIHIGRLTSQRHDETIVNAYKLNNEAQFAGKDEKQQEEVHEEVQQEEVHEEVHEEVQQDFQIQDEYILSTNKGLSRFGKYETYVINLDRRIDRMYEFYMNTKDSFKFMGSYKRYSAVDGSKLVTNTQLQRIFDFNDYNMRRGMVGCAMSHIDLYVRLLESDKDAFIILEDDITLVPNFEEKLTFLLLQIAELDWDMVYLGHHVKKAYMDDKYYDKSIMPHVEKWDTRMSLKISLGGTGGYIINRRGAERLLEFINTTGMTNGIDTVQQRAADTMDIFYSTPHLIYTECWRGEDDIDTDIQYDYSSLTRSIEDRLDDELEYFKSINVPTRGIGDMYEAIEEAKIVEEGCTVRYHRNAPVNIRTICKTSNVLCYTLNDELVFMISNPTQQILDERYIHRLKKYGKYDVSDALQT